MLGKRQFSIGKLAYITMFVATLVTCVQVGYPYGFIYPGAFIVLVTIYVVWKISRPIQDLPDETILEEWAGDDTSTRSN